MAKQTDFYKTQIRIPKELHQLITSSAKENGRSMNAEIITRLQEIYDHHRKLEETRGEIREMAQQEVERATREILQRVKQERGNSL